MSNDNGFSDWMKPMNYADFDDDDFSDDYSYGLSEKQIRERMNYAINGDELEDDTELDFGDLDDDEGEGEDDE